MTNKIPYIIAASTIAMVLLVLIQVKWMQQSRDLIEDQFNQKVSMALCMAVDEVSKAPTSKEVKMTCGASPFEAFSKSCCSDQLHNYLANDNVKEVVEEALNYYNIFMPFEMKVVSKKEDAICKLEESPTYSCSLSPLVKSDEHKLNINFPGKSEYILKEMGLMLTASIIILFIIFGIFIYANYYLIKQKRLSERNKDFFNHMAHEFKTPLTNIGLAARMLKKKSESQLVNIITAENEQLSEQVTRVLSMASMDTADFEISQEKINIYAFTKEILDKIDIQLSSKNAVVQLDESHKELFILADRFHLCNALRNILDNAIKYNNKKPRISIAFQEINNNIHIQIEDNGLGIDRADQKLIFKKFYRVNSTNDYKNKGFGLGLSYVKRIVELHKGEINIFSELNKGTRFDLLLPKWQA
ncbi:HAMP domain-containing histidine kinase [Saprospiraceae bacterium]|nr:HAMP domain-containing histidine kinase [Saprospiraceae bacterium]